MKNLPPHLTVKIRKALRTSFNARETAAQALACLDLTSLDQNDNDDTARALCARANTPQGYAAAICLYPHFLAAADEAMNTAPVNIATVVNYPTGATCTRSPTPVSAENTAGAIKTSVLAGANEIEVTFPWQAFKAGNITLCNEIMEAAADACTRTGVRLKVIMETSAFDDAQQLTAACAIALRQKPDFLKTSTGKLVKDGRITGVTPEGAAVMMEAIKNVTDGETGVKISGGIRTTADCAVYMALARAILGHDIVHPRTFRIGASFVLDDLMATLGRRTASNTTCPRPAALY